MGTYEKIEQIHLGMYIYDQEHDREIIIEAIMYDLIVGISAYCKVSPHINDFYSEWVTEWIPIKELQKILEGGDEDSE